MKSTYYLTPQRFTSIRRTALVGEVNKHVVGYIYPICPIVKFTISVRNVHLTHYLTQQGVTSMHVFAAKVKPHDFSGTPDDTSCADSSALGKMMIPVNLLHLAQHLTPQRLPALLRLLRSVTFCA